LLGARHRRQDALPRGHALIFAKGGSKLANICASDSGISTCICRPSGPTSATVFPHKVLSQSTANTLITGLPISALNRRAAAVAMAHCSSFVNGIWPKLSATVSNMAAPFTNRSNSSGSTTCAWLWESELTRCRAALSQLPASGSRAPVPSQVCGHGHTTQTKARWGWLSTAPRRDSHSKRECSSRSPPRPTCPSSGRKLLSLRTRSGRWRTTCERNQMVNEHDHVHAGMRETRPPVPARAREAQLAGAYDVGLGIAECHRCV
jgi:hypothetical protein